MTRRQGEEVARQTQQGETQRTGLLVRGVVQRRWKKTLANGAEVVSYDVDGHVLTTYRPTSYFAVGQMVEVPVSVSLWQSKNGWRYNLTIMAAYDGEF